jgi:hypothetical protein
MPAAGIVLSRYLPLIFTQPVLLRGEEGSTFA